MAYSTASVVAYCNTGFSMINTPATPAVLASSGTSYDLGQINCLSLIGKRAGTIRVREFAGIASCDYLRIVFSDNPISSYWIVTGYEYVSGDTIVISIALDGFLTCGGTAGITSISGYVNRHTVTNDTYGKYNQDDEMLIPSQNLIFRSIDKFGLKSTSEDYYTIVLSTINLLELGTRSAEDMGLTYGGVDDVSGQGVTVPNIPQIPSGWVTSVKYGDYSYDIPGAYCFDLDGTVTSSADTTYPIREGISRARSLGVEGGIIAMYALPKSKFACEYKDVTLDLPIVGSVTLHALISVIKPAEGATLTHNTSINFNFKTVNNKRALYGGLSKVKLVSIASGEEAEYNLEDLYSPTHGNTGVTINEVGDGRAHGKPYFFPKYFMDAEQKVDNLLSSISGLEWQNVPIVYQYSSGEGIQRNRYFATTQIGAQNLLNRQNTNMFFAGQGLVTGGLTSASSSALAGVNAYMGSNVMAGAGIGLNVASNIMSSQATLQQTLANNELTAQEFVKARNLEKKDLMINTRVVSPEIAFPVNESTRDYVGNGCLVAFITPTDADITRFDKILTMYGYKDAGTQLTLADLSAGTHFSYIEASGVQIQTSVNVDRNIKELAETQISSGIRIWKSRPDFSKYNGSNR